MKQNMKPNPRRANFMKRMFLLSLAAVFGLALILSSGCDENQNDTGLESQTVNDVDTSFMNSFFGEDEIFSPADQSAELSLALIGHQFGISPSSKKGTSGIHALQGEDVEITITAVNNYTYSNGWHIWSFEATVVNLVELDTSDVSGIDSVQILENGVPIQLPTDSTALDGLKARAHVNWTQRQTTNQGFSHHRVDFDLDTVGADTIVTINGSVDDTLNVNETGEMGMCQIDVTIDQTITDLQFFTDSTNANDCPLGGQINSTTTLDVLCVNDMGSGMDTLQINGT
jgi:hypothetical protein